MITYILVFKIGSEWDQPPVEMRPLGSIPIKVLSDLLNMMELNLFPVFCCHDYGLHFPHFFSQDYAIETPLKKSSALVEGDLYYEVKIDFHKNIDITAINFVLKV